MKKIRCISFFVLQFIVFNIFAQTQSMTVDQVVDKVVKTLNSSKGIEAAFSLQGGSSLSKGTFKTDGSKFSLVFPQVASWYDGKNLYSYNGSTQETTVVVPTSEELSEINPLLYVKNGTKGYKTAFSSVKVPGKYVVELVPEKKNDGIIKLRFFVDSKSFLPEKIEIYSKSGDYTITLTSLKTGKTFDLKEFIYPSNKYPKAEIIDLR